MVTLNYTPYADSQKDWAESLSRRANDLTYTDETEAAIDTIKRLLSLGHRRDLAVNA